MNYASNVLSVLLQTANILLENPVNKKHVRTKVWFNQGSQRSYVTQTIRNFFKFENYLPGNYFHFYISE